LEGRFRHCSQLESQKIEWKKTTLGGNLFRMPTVTKSDRVRILVADAANAAMKYFQSLFPRVRKVSLEEVELSDDEKFWMITLGFELPSDHPDIPSELLPPKTKFKVFKVNAQTGEVLSMKIRSLE
jgi:hypothetical protein